MRTIRGNSGIGDNIYVRAVAEHFLRKGERVTVCSNWPDLFAGLECKVEPHRRINVTTHAVYTTRKKYRDTNQWQDVCIQAGILPYPLSISWQCRNASLVAELRAMAWARPLVLVHGGRAPMGRTDGFGRELMPQRRAFEAVLRGFEDCFTVRVGHGPDAYPLPVSLDMNGRTSVSDLLDLGQACDAVVGQCSLAVPLAEAFSKPAMFVWAAAGLRAPHEYVRQITPQKILSKETSAFVIDAWADQQIEDEVRAFRLVA